MTKPIEFEEAFAAYEAGERESLLPRLGEVVEAGAGDPRLWHIHGLVLRELDRRDEALRSLRTAARIAPGSARIAHALARTLLEAGLPSVDAFARAVRLEPSDVDAAAGLTAAFVAAGEPQTAIDGLTKILKRSPHWVQGHALLSRLRWAQGEKDDFARSFDEALAENPLNLDLRREQLITLVHADRYEQALESVAAGRAAIGNHLIFDVNEAIIHAEMGDTETAERLFEPFADIVDPAVQVRRVRMYLRSGRPHDAAHVLEPWLETPAAFMFWPYASLAWRQVDEARWHWLEGDEPLVGVYDIADRLPPLDVLAENSAQAPHAGRPTARTVAPRRDSDGRQFVHARRSVNRRAARGGSRNRFRACREVPRS